MPALKDLEGTPKFPKKGVTYKSRRYEWGERGWPVTGLCRKSSEGCTADGVGTLPQA